MNLDLAGKTAIVTGGSAGLGLHTARALAAEGARVAVCGRDQARVHSAVAELEALGASVLGRSADVLDAAEARQFVAAVVAWSGSVDVLVNNVGGSQDGDLFTATDEQWQSTFDRNLFQAIRLIRTAAPHMPRGSAIVNIASVSGWRSQLSGTFQYGAAKAALIYLTEPLALQLAPAGIRVNTISPGSITWPGGGWDRFAGNEPEVFAAYLRDGFPAGRLGRPEELAEVVTFLASPRAAWVNGRHIAVDGLQQPVPPSVRSLWRPPRAPWPERTPPQPEAEGGSTDG